MSDMAKREDVISILETQTISEAAGRMKEAGVGFLVVLDSDGAGVGALTDRDLTLRAVARRLAKETPVKEVMSSPLQTLDADATRAEQVARMASLGLRRIALAREDRVVGVISHDDLAAELGAELDCLVGATARRCIEA